MILFSDFTRLRVIIQLKIIITLLAATLIDQYSFFHFLPFQPSFFLITLFFWTMFFGRHLSFTLVFFFGLFADLIGGSLIGDTTLAMLSFYGGISFYREHYSNDHGQEWAILWCGTIGVILIHFFIIWAIHKQIFFSIDHVIGYLFSLLFYPSLKRILYWFVGEQA